MLPKNNNSPKGLRLRKLKGREFKTSNINKTVKGRALMHHMKEWVFYYSPFLTSQQNASQFITLATPPSPTVIWCDAMEAQLIFNGNNNFYSQTIIIIICCYLIYK
jgi:hypothetical protein